MPEGTDTFTLSVVLTAAGATVSAGLIASVIQLLKLVPVFGPWIDENREPGVAVILSGILVGVAYFGTSTDINILSGFAAFLAWVGIARLATAGYDTAVSVKEAIAG
jgi:hypothetical protein